MKQQGAARLRERQITQFIQDNQVHLHQSIRQFALIAGIFFPFQ